MRTRSNLRERVEQKYRQHIKKGPWLRSNLRERVEQKLDPKGGR